METKEQLVQSIREWVKIDNEMRTLKRELNNRKKAKEAISSKGVLLFLGTSFWK